MITRSLSRSAAGWGGFAAAVLLATAPVWRLWLFGFSPSLDEALRLALCGAFAP